MGVTWTHTPQLWVLLKLPWHPHLSAESQLFTASCPVKKAVFSRLLPQEALTKNISFALGLGKLTSPDKPPPHS